MYSRSSKKNVRKKTPSKYPSVPKQVSVVKPSKLASAILEKVLHSFNVSYLDRLHGNDYAYVKRTLIDRSDTFSLLIQNFEDDVAKPAKFISGPQTFITLTHPSKTIILIGEQHINQEDCGKYSYRTRNNFYDYSLDRLVSLEYDTAMEFAEAGLGELFEPSRVNDVMLDVMENGIAYVDLYVEEDPYNYFALGEVYDNLDNLSAVAAAGLQSKIGRTHFSDVRGSSQLSKLPSYDERFQFGISLEILLNPSFNVETKKKYVPLFKKWHSYLFDPRLTDEEWKERNINFILEIP